MRWPRSIRLRLALATAGVLLLLGSALGIASYRSLEASLEQEARSFALHEAQEIAHIVSSLTSREDVLLRGGDLNGLFPEEGVLGFGVFDLEGAPVYRQPDAPGPWSEPWPAGFREAKQGRPAYEDVLRPDLPASLRIALVVDYQRSPRWYVVSVVSRENGLAALARFRTVYGLGFAAALVLGCGGCLVLLWMALRPLSRMVDDAERLAGEPTALLEEPPEGSELRELATLLNGLLERDRRALESLRRFTAHAGHELRTPLARIRAEAELALGRGEEGAYRGCIEDMLEETEELGRVIDALLELARAGDSDLADAKPFPLQPLLVELVEQAQVVGGSPRRVVLEAPEDADAVWVRGNRVLLDRALWNLLDNALKFGKPEGRVQLRMRTDADGIEIEVADDGPGVPGSQDLFEPFFRGAGLGPQVPGLGLGLALTRAVLRRHGGEVRARRDAALGGACFVVRLPRWEE